MTRKWSSRSRKEHLKTAENRAYDVIIIGAGITGAGLARECALRGISFCLLDKNDFAAGTSSRSSKLFHGGMRYLATGEFGLVRESTLERNWLRNHLPNLVRPLGFVYPAYSKSKSRPLTIYIAIKLYDIISDWFTEFKNYRKSRVFSAKFIEEFEPALAAEDPDLGKLKMAGFYYDTNCDDARVTLETIKESLGYAGEKSSALNYTQVYGYIKDKSGRVCGVKARDNLSGNSCEFRGGCVVSASGIWTDDVLAAADYDQKRIYPTKGVHLVVPSKRLGNRNAFSLNSLDDGRFFFVLRRGNVSIIGTTDTDYLSESNNLDEPYCNKDDCDYLLRTVNRIFPHAMLTYDDIIATYAGIRPLIRQEAVGNESDISRKHEIFQTNDGIVAIAGGKSTTFRRMAEDLLFYLSDHNLVNSFTRPEFKKRGFSKLPFKVGLSRQEFDRMMAENYLYGIVKADQLNHLYTQYGLGGIEILEAVKMVPETAQPLLEGFPYCVAEIVYILEHENAPKLIDIMSRRTEIQWMVWHQKQPHLGRAVASIMASYYSWSEEKKSTEIKEYLDYVEKNVRFLKQ